MVVMKTRKGGAHSMPRRLHVTMAALAVLVLLSQNGLMTSIQQKHRLSSESTVGSNNSLFKNDMMNGDESPFFPLIIGAGQGTTGTRSIQNAVCKLGIPSVHFNQACYRGNLPFNNSTKLFKRTKNGVNAHVKVIETWKAIRDCVSEARSQSQECTEIDSLLSALRRHVTQVIQSGIGAIHDIPYTMMIPFVLKVARETRGTEPIILLTERNPQEWAARRVQTHELTPQLACNDPKGAFDIDYCLESGFGASDLFHAYTDYTDSAEQEEYVSLLSKSMDHYQKSIRELKPVYDVNMFESKERIDDTVMEDSIWISCTPRLSSAAIKELKQRQQLGGLKKKKILGPKAYPSIAHPRKSHPWSFNTKLHKRE